MEKGGGYQLGWLAAVWERVGLYYQFSNRGSGWVMN